MRILFAFLLAVSAQAATYISGASGNLSANTTWFNVETGASSQTLTIASINNTGTSYATAIAFTVTNNDVITGVLMHCKQSTTTGTVTVGISDDNGSTWTREVTVNATDLPTSYSWVFFKFASTLTGDGGTDYKVSFKGSSTNNATFARAASANDWCKLLMLNTNPGAAPTADDVLYVVGERTGAGASTPYTVTWDDTASTDFGAVTICSLGTITFATSASTNYTMKVSGDLTVWANGTLNIGTVATPMPGTSTGTLLLDCGSNVQYGLLLKDGSTFVAQGASKTDRAMLAADAAANATSLTTDVSTSWADNDVIAVASTTQTNSQTEKGAMNGAASGTSLTVDGFGGTGGGIAAAHSGTSPTRAEIINLTRNVVIKGASASNQAYIHVGNLATVDVDWAEFYWLGSGSTNKRGIDLQTTTGTAAFNRCAIHDFSVTGSVGFYQSGAASSNVTITNCVGYNINEYFVLVDATSGTYTITGNVFLRNVWYHIYALNDVGGVFSGNTAVGAAQHGVQLNEAAAIGTFSDITSHSNTQSGIFVLSSPSPGSTLSNLTIWRNYSIGGVAFHAAALANNLTISTLTSFGNGVGSLSFGGNVWNTTITGFTSSGDSSFASPWAISFPSGVNNVWCVYCNLSPTDGGMVVHSTADITIASGAMVEFYGDSVKLGATTKLQNFDTNARDGSFVRINGYQAAAGTHQTWRAGRGIISADAALYKAAAPSERLAPVSASLKLESGPHRAAVASGGTIQFCTWVRKSSTSDTGGADYGGNQPRLVLKRNYAAGITADTVLATAAGVKLQEWEQLCGTSAAVTDDAVLEAVVDADGTAGWINVDDWSVTPAGQDQGKQKYWFLGLPGAGIGGGGGGNYITIR